MMMASGYSFSSVDSFLRRLSMVISIAISHQTYFALGSSRKRSRIPNIP